MTRPRASQAASRAQFCQLSESIRRRQSAMPRDGVRGEKGTRKGRGACGSSCGEEGGEARAREERGTLMIRRRASFGSGPFEKFTPGRGPARLAHDQYGRADHHESEKGPDVGEVRQQVEREQCPRRGHDESREQRRQPWRPVCLGRTWQSRSSNKQPEEENNEGETTRGRQIPGTARARLYTGWMAAKKEGGSSPSLAIAKKIRGCPSMVTSSTEVIPVSAPTETSTRAQGRPTAPKAADTGASLSMSW